MHTYQKSFSSILLISLLPLPAMGQIYRWDNGEVIPYTQNITLRPRMQLTWWDRDFRNLEYADFSGGLDLHESKFDHSNVRKARFNGANLTGSQFNDTWLSNASFKNANLTDTNFTSASLSGANLSGAWIVGASFRRTVVAGGGITTSQLESTASYESGDLQGINLERNDLTDCDLSGQNLTNTKLYNANLTGVNLTDAIILKSYFSSTTDSGFTAELLYSTHSYKMGNLQGIWLEGNNMSGWNYAGIHLEDVSFSSSNMAGANLSGTVLKNASFNKTNLTNANLSNTQLNGASFVAADLSGVDFTGLDIKSVSLGKYSDGTGSGITKAQFYSTSNYQSGDLREIILLYNSLSEWDLSGYDLTGASLQGCKLGDADLSNAKLENANLSRAKYGSVNLSGAIVGRANFEYATSGGFTPDHLYSTASYQTADLRGLDLSGNDMNGWNFANQRLTDSRWYQAWISGAILTGADLRGARQLDTSFQLSKAITRNTIRKDGVISGLELLASEKLKIHDYDGGIAVKIRSDFAMDTLSTLEIIFEDVDWGSTITLDLADGALAHLDGTLFLTLKNGIDEAALIGRTFDVFDWNGFLSSGETFADVAWPAGFDWDVSDLYVGGTVTLLAIPEPATAALLAFAALAWRRR